jgi:hypothetical protein
MATKGGCKIVIHDIMCTLDLHLTWVILQIMDVANTINYISRRVMFQKLHVAKCDIIQFIPFVHAFYAFNFPYIIAIVIKMGMLMSSHQSWVLGKVIH